MNESSGWLAATVLAWLASPLAWCVGTLFLFATLVRWQVLQTRRGGVLLLVGLLSLLTLVAWQDAVAQELLWPTQFFVLLFLSINLFALWLALHERLAAEQHEEDEREEEIDLNQAPFFSTAELWPATAVVLGVFAAALFFDVPSAASQGAGFFYGEMQLRGILVPWIADFLLPFLLLATLVALPWLHRPAEEGPAVEPIPRNAGLVFFGLAWLLLVLLPMAEGAFQILQPSDDGLSAEATSASSARTLAQAFWYQAWGMEMPSFWFLRESPGIMLLLFYFVLLPFLLPRWRASRGFCRRCLKALGKRRYAVLMFLLLMFSLVPLKMVSLWWFGIGQWIAIPELSFSF